MVKWLRNIIVNYLTRNLLKAVTIEDILSITGKDWKVSGRKLTGEEILLLKEEAASFEKSIFWKLMMRDLKYKMTLQRFDKATTADDMMFGKALAYSIEMIETFINKIKSL